MAKLQWTAKFRLYDTSPSDDFWIERLFLRAQ